MLKRFSVLSFLLFLLFLCFYGFAIKKNLINEGNIGQTQSNLRATYFAVDILTSEEIPEYFKIYGDPDSDACYVSIKDMKNFRKYFEELLKAAKKFDEEVKNSVASVTAEEITFAGSEVIIPWKGKMFYNEDKEYECVTPLYATLE